MVNDNYVNVVGLNTTLDVSGSLNPDWIKKNLTKQVLPNGLCAYSCALFVMAEESAFIQEELYRNFNFIHSRNNKILYYDCTNYYFEIEKEDGIKCYGKAKSADLI